MIVEIIFKIYNKYDVSNLYFKTELTIKKKQ